MIDYHSIDMVLPDNCTKGRLGGPGLRRVKMKVRSDIHIRRAESRDAPTIAILLAEAFAEYQSLYTSCSGRRSSPWKSYSLICRVRTACGSGRLIFSRKDS